MQQLFGIMGKPGKCSVDEGSFFLKRLYLVERELMRTLGGYLINITNWDMKTKIPRHIWQDSLRADALRSRILEMRYPRRDVDQGHDESLQAFLSHLIRCVNDQELLEGIYFVTKKALCEAYEHYYNMTDELDDAPSIALLRRFIPEIRAQLEEAQELYQGVSSLTSISEWQVGLQSELINIGGLLGNEPKNEKSWENPIITSRPVYVPPLEPVRDSNYTKAVYHMPPRNPDKFIERQVWAGINHVNEIWAAEIAALVLWTWNDMPWEFYLDCARWSYDEARHCLMGVRRLEAWGFSIGVDYPIVADHYKSVSSQGELAVLALLHAFEVNGPYWKSMMKSEFEALGDTASSQDFDYDWADESIHLQYGHKWVLHRLGGDLEALEDMKQDTMNDWSQWIEKKQQEWDYEPFTERIQLKIAEIEAISRG